MRHALAIICGLLFVAVPGVAQSKSDQDTTTTDQAKTTDKVQTDKTQASKAQIVGTAEITKIDAKKKTLQVRQVVESNNSATTDSTGPSTNRRTGGGYPGGRLSRRGLSRRRLSGGTQAWWLSRRRISWRRRWRPARWPAYEPGEGV